MTMQTMIMMIMMMMMQCLLTFKVDPATAVSVNISNHVVDVCLRQVVTELFQNPPEKNTYTPNTLLVGHRSVDYFGCVVSSHPFLDGADLYFSVLFVFFVNLLYLFTFII